MKVLSVIGMYIGICQKIIKKIGIQYGSMLVQILCISLEFIIMQCICIKVYFCRCVVIKYVVLEIRYAVCVLSYI